MTRISLGNIGPAVVRGRERLREVVAVLLREALSHRNFGGLSEVKQLHVRRVTGGMKLLLYTAKRVIGVVLAPIEGVRG